MTLCLICLWVTVSSCSCMGDIAEGWAPLTVTGVGLLEEFTAGVKAACGGGKAMGCVDTTDVSRPERWSL